MFFWRWASGGMSIDWASMIENKLNEQTNKNSTFILLLRSKQSNKVDLCVNKYVKR